MAPSGPAPGSTTAPSPSATRDESDAGNLEALIAEIQRQGARASDPNRLFQAYPQAKPGGFHGLPNTRPGPFPGAPFATVTAYSANFAGDLVGYGCNVLASDGTLCPGVNAPGVTLSEAQTSRLVDLIRAAGLPLDAGAHHTGRPHLTGDFAAHLAFVFFDKAHVPMGELDVSFDESVWNASPSVPGLFGSMTEQERTSIVALCEELGIDGCWRGDPRFKPALEAMKSMPARPAHHEADDFGPSVDLDGVLAATSPFERRALCAHSLRALGLDPRYPGASYQSPDGRRWKMLDYQACESKFPLCKARVRDVLACQRWLTGMASHEDASGKSVCSGLDDCVWALRVEPGPT